MIDAAFFAQRAAEELRMLTPIAVANLVVLVADGGEAGFYERLLSEDIDGGGCTCGGCADDDDDEIDAEALAAADPRRTGSGERRRDAARNVRERL
jgi:hypothetical protein